MRVKGLIYQKRKAQLHGIRVIGRESSVPNWGELLNQLNGKKSPVDEMRHKYIGILSEYTERNIISYYSAFIQKPLIEGTGINENDKNAFMQAVHGLDRSKGLDLILHTPGGDIATTESIVYYLHKLFGSDIRVFVPQIAMSAGTMIALAAKEIVMGKQSNLGPIDPQFGGMSCAAIIDEFEEAIDAVKRNPDTAAIWGTIIGKYHPTFIGDCKNAIKWAEEIAQKWMCENMFREYDDKEERSQKVLQVLTSHGKTLSHARHIHSEELKSLGLTITDLEGMDDTPKEDCKDLQDCVLTLHHSYMHTFGTTDSIKIVENQNGNAMIQVRRE